MSKDLVLMIIGALVALLPFLGFPSKWDTIIFVALGLLIIILVFMLRRDFVRHLSRIKHHGPEHADRPFEESALPFHNLKTKDIQKAPSSFATGEELLTPPSPAPVTPPPPPPPRSKRTSRKRASIKKLKINEENQEEGRNA